MEVFLANVPQQLADRTLQEELRPYMKALGITEWSCSSRRNKTIGFITFLHYNDGFTFLRRHGKNAAAVGHTHTMSQTRTGIDIFFPAPFLSNPPKEKPNLRLMGKGVFAAQSNKAPDPYALRCLAYPKQREEPTTDAKVVFHIMSLACGHNSFRNPVQALTFVEQCRLEARGTAKFGKKQLVLDLAVDNKLEIPYSSIMEMIHNSSPCTFTLILSEPPRFYGSIDPLPNQFARLGISSQATDKRSDRCTSLPHHAEHAKFAGRCLVYQLSIVDPDFDSKMRRLEKRNLFSIAHFQIAHDANPAKRDLDYLSSWDLFYKNVTRMATRNTLPFRILFLLQSLVWNNFLHPRVAHDLATKMEVLFRKARTQGDPDPLSDQAIRNLRDGTRDLLPFPFHDISPEVLDPDEILKYLLEVEERIQTESDYRVALYGPELATHQAWIFKAVVTPTRITLHGPELEPLNRILRKYPNHTDYFMRVQFCDEDGTDLFFNPKISYDKVFDRYKKVLNEGIAVAGRIFQFLGFSHSSLRSHSTWFSAPFWGGDGKLQLYRNIIESLGDFAHIRIPAKCAARIGQAFSETPSFISLTESDIQCRNMPDVKSQDGNCERVFSDGVGTISQEALELIWPRLLRGSSVPTCLQIRWGGVKGMLSLDSRLPGRVMFIRKESMEKFPSNDTENLEICDAASKPLRLVLNRQLIKIMEDLGVKDDFFLRLQKMELDRLRAVTADAYNTGTFLNIQGIGINHYLPTFIKKLDKYGIDYRKDDFLRSVVESVVLRELRLLKHKARIPVLKGATLFGIMDETGFLAEGEIYICFDVYHPPGKPPIEKLLRDRSVLVTRSPALHPGDIQLVKMRTPPPGHPLLNLRNCVVFSQFGKRDLPSQLSGGDLDGDIYNVIWDEEAMPQRLYPAADYPRVTPVALGRQVEREDMANWFVDFMKSDVLGMIATRHLILSDQDSQGTLGPHCLTLAGLHSTAVDFSKTGIPVETREIPKAPRYRPDFLAPAPPVVLYDRHQIDFLADNRAPARDDDDDSVGPNHQYYKSDKILGVLYRNVDEKHIWNEDIRRVKKQDGPSVWDQFVGLMQREIEEATEGRVSHLTKRIEAKRLQDVYEDTVMSLMTQYSDYYLKPLSEVEVFCGSIFNRTGSQTRRQKDNSKKLKAEFDRLSEWLVSQMRLKRRQTEQAGHGVSAHIDNALYGDQLSSFQGDNESLVNAPYPSQEALEMSYACLMVGLPHKKDVDNERGAQLQSFKVIAASVLMKELTAFVNALRSRQAASTAGDYGGAGGGFVGVSSGPEVAYAYNGYDVDVGQYPNYGYSEYPQ
ncbi:RNA-dependent RNA polymerase 2 [Colletotrichum trifolii]|uniref:RNA-dependent RNA polymerase n=1 Tax=Colletotrichum trifolii TaxID=5466 RepID=A0A4V3HUB8_COLTR|nr:RNA-dependent RNA polymerase 2 [Colletotrichum trifolii]